MFALRESRRPSRGFVGKWICVLIEFVREFLVRWSNSEPCQRIRWNAQGISFRATNLLLKRILGMLEEPKWHSQRSKLTPKWCLERPKWCQNAKMAPPAAEIGAQMVSWAAQVEPKPNPWRFRMTFFGPVPHFSTSLMTVWCNCGAFCWSKLDKNATQKQSTNRCQKVWRLMPKSG